MNGKRSARPGLAATAADYSAQTHVIGSGCARGRRRNDGADLGSRLVKATSPVDAADPDLFDTARTPRLSGAALHLSAGARWDGLGASAPTAVLRATSSGMGVTTRVNNRANSTALSPWE
jgi:hypothetical protein